MTYDQIKEKIISRDDARALFSESFRKDKRLVFTNGCFDILHRGHVYYLSKAREMGDVLVIGLNTDASVRRLKGQGRPVNGEGARAEVLAALVMVDYIVPFGEDTPLELIKAVKPQVLVKGGDYRVEDIVGHEQVRSWGGEVCTVPLVEGYSTSSILGK